MPVVALEPRVGRLEDLMAELTANVNRLSAEMRDFKDEMRDFKDEMRDFKDEMRDFKDEMRDFKDEMSDFKDEMSDFKDEMSDFKDESRRQIKAMNRKWGELANKMGTLAEDLVAPSIPRILRELVGCPGDELEFFAVRVRGKAKSGETQEFDVIAVCGEYLLINETKSRLRPEDVGNFIALLERAREFLPQYAERKIVGVLATFYVDPSLILHGERQGLIMLGASDGVMEMLNSPGFTPRLF